MHDKNKDAKFDSIAKRLFRTQSKVYDAAFSQKANFFCNKIIPYQWQTVLSVKKKEAN